MTNFKFPKTERLTNKKKLELLFEESEMLKAFPLKLIFRIDHTPTEDHPPIQFAFTVPKRSFKKAVDRNFLKRRIKEAYRLHKHLIADSQKEFYGLFIYTNREKQDFHSIEKSMVKVLNKLKSFLEEK